MRCNGMNLELLHLDRARKRAVVELKFPNRFVRFEIHVTEVGNRWRVCKLNSGFRSMWNTSSVLADASWPSSFQLIDTINKILSKASCVV